MKIYQNLFPVIFSYFHSACYISQILQCDGNLFDAVSLAVKAALFSTQIPRVTGAILDGGKPDIQLSDDPFDCVKLDVSSFPVLVTLCKVNLKINSEM